MDYENFKEALVEGQKEKKNATKNSHDVIDENKRKVAIKTIFLQSVTL